MVATSATRFKAGFAIEQTLGHVTHGRNLRRLLADEPDFEMNWLEVPFRPNGRVYNLPPVSLNWSLRGGLFLRNHLRQADWLSLDAALLHTSTITLFSAPFARRVPTVISVDATPVNMDSLAGGYVHRRQPRAVERLKRALVARALSFARGYVSWSQWAKASLVNDYGVDPERVLVVAPGTDLDLFARPPTRRDGPPRILFVGGDFARKGGDLLLGAFRQSLRGRAELHLVTAYPVQPEEGVFVYRDLGPNSEALIELYRQADVFALPTRADCLAVVLGEAMAASLPVVTTNVGAHAEVVEHGSNGLIVEADDPVGLTEALLSLVEDTRLRNDMGQRARLFAEHHFDGKKNARMIAAHLRAAAGG